jgi:hypothetical protein
VVVINSVVLVRRVKVQKDRRRKNDQGRGGGRDGREREEEEEGEGPDGFFVLSRLFFFSFFGVVSFNLLSLFLLAACCRAVGVEGLLVGACFFFPFLGEDVSYLFAEFFTPLLRGLVPPPPFAGLDEDPFFPPPPAATLAPCFFVGLDAATFTLFGPPPGFFLEKGNSKAPPP